MARCLLIWKGARINTINNFYIGTYYKPNLAKFPSPNGEFEINFCPGCCGACFRPLRGYRKAHNTIEICKFRLYLTECNGMDTV